MDRLLRVGLDATPLLGRPTGVGVFCRASMEALAKRADVEVVAFAISWRRRHLIADVLPESVTATGRAMPARPLHALWHHADWPPLEWFVPNLDVVHGTNFVVPPCRHTTAVVTVHDLTPVRFPELCDGATLAFVDLVRRALHRGAWVHTHSDHVAAEVVEFFDADPARVRAVAPGVPALPPAARSSLDGVVPRGRYILSVGTAEPRKDLPGLVKSFDELAHQDADLSLVLAGPPGWQEERLEAAIASSHFSERIVRTGWVDDAALASLLDGAAVLAYPSLYEGFGFPPLQAMAHGVPVVSTTAGSLPEVIGSAGVLVNPGDHDALTQALGEVLDGPGTKEALIAAGRARIGGFTWEATAAGLAQLYRDAKDEADGGGGRGR